MCDEVKSCASRESYVNCLLAAARSPVKPISFRYVAVSYTVSMGERTSQAASLLVKLNNQLHQEIRLDLPELTIGRAKDNDLVVADPCISAHHARLVKVQSLFYVEDLGSTNGTFINGLKIAEQPLKDLDEISIGTYRLFFRESDTPRKESQTESDAIDATIVLRPKVRPLADVKPVSALLSHVDGKTILSAHRIRGPIAIIGAHEHAAVKLTGWFAPKVAAILERQAQSFAIRPGPGAKLTVNQSLVIGSTVLKSGDLIEVAGLKLIFSLAPERPSHVTS
jgi:pSer/pThr/pTyr-binding forkhead associated (FHA) protein